MLALIVGFVSILIGFKSFNNARLNHRVDIALQQSGKIFDGALHGARMDYEHFMQEARPAFERYHQGITSAKSGEERDLVTQQFYTDLSSKDKIHLDSAIVLASYIEQISWCVDRGVCDLDTICDSVIYDLAGNFMLSDLPAVSSYFDLTERPLDINTITRVRQRCDDVSPESYVNPAYFQKSNE